MTKLVGVDVSRYNGRPNWKVAKANGVEFAILRAVSGARGGYIDPTFEYNYKKCKEVGIHVGIYIASYLNIDREIALTNQVIKGKQFEFPIYFDVEGFSVAGTGLNRNEITERTLKFCNYFENKGYYVGIYSSASFFDSVLIPSKISKIDRWVADWRKGRSYSMHQYTNRGQWKGIPNTGEGGVDSNTCTIDYPKIIKGAGLNGFKKTIQKTEVKGLSKMEEEKLLDQIKQTVVTYEAKDYELALKIAKQHKAILVPAELNMDFGKMKKSKDTIIGIGNSTGKISGKDYGITGYCDYLVSSDKVDEFLKNRTKFLRRK